MSEVAGFKKEGDAVQLLSVTEAIEARPPDPARGYMPAAESDEWGTPLELFCGLDDEFHFDLDAAASQENACCARYYNRHDDGLKLPWEGNVFCNPPYGRGVGEWVRKAREEVLAGRAAVAVLLLKATTDVRWWHAYVWDKARHQPYPGVQVRFPEGRLCFEVPGKPKNVPAPFSSVIIVMRKPAE